jgi:hypothetical protein
MTFYEFIMKELRKRGSTLKGQIRLSSGWNKKIGIEGLLLIPALVLLAIFFNGSIGPAMNFEGSGMSLPTGGRMSFDTGYLPDWWQECDLRVRCGRGQDCAALRFSGPLDKNTLPPYQSKKGDAFFRLRINHPQPSKLVMINSSRQVLTITKIDWRNYTVINIGFPRFAVLLNPFPGPGFSISARLGLALGTALVMLWIFVLLHRRDQSRWNHGVRWGTVLFPWLVLALAVGLRLQGRQLLITWEAFLMMIFPGAFYWGLTTRVFQKKLLGFFWVFLIAATFLILLGTVLGVGFPVRDFGPLFIYQTHFTRTARYAGIIYIVLSFGLYRQKKEWFSPERHLGLSSIWFVFLPAMIIYLTNGFSDFGGDTTFNSLLPWRILQGEGLYYSKTYVELMGSKGLLPIGNGFLPVFPIGPGFLGLPTALIQYFWSPEPLNHLIAWNQKVTAVWVAAFSTAVVFQIVYLISRKFSLSLLLTAGFALGTSQPTISAAVLWQHGPSILLISLGLLFLIRGQQENPAFYALSALPLAFLPLMRTQAVLFYLAALVSVAILQPKKLVGYFLWSLPGIAAVLWVNLGLYHALLGGYAYQASGDNFATPFWEGAIGSLFSPNRGLLAFSPFLILGFIGGGILWIRRSVIAFTFGAAALLFFVIHAKYAHWHGGWCVAPRFTSELIPVLVFFSVYGFLEWKKFWVRLAAGLLVAVSITINLPGSFYLNEQGAWNFFPNVDNYRQERVWDFQDWLPFHFRYWVRLENYEEVPAFPFVVNDYVEPLKSRVSHYRVKTALEETPSEIIRLNNVPLREGFYQIQVKGDSRSSTGTKAELILGFVGYKVENVAFPIERNSSMTLSHRFHMEKKGRIDVRLKLSGKGSLILDTVRIIPVKKGNFTG